MKNLIIALFACGLSLPSFALIGLKAKEIVPALKLRDTSGKEYQLDKLERKTILVFYRGSWCPYCIAQLKEINTELVKAIKTKNVQILAISVDRPPVARKMKKRHKLNFSIISDSKARSLLAFNIANKLDDELVKKYKESYKIEVEADSGESHHIVAHPAVFIIQKGKILFADVHTNYKKRTSHKMILNKL